MRIIALIAVTNIALAASTLAAPRLALDIVATEYLYAGMSDQPTGSKVIARTHRLLKSGKAVTLRAAGNQFTVTPKLLRNGSVDYSEVLVMRYDAPKPMRSVLEKRNPVPIGSPLEERICVGLIDFSTRTSITK